MQQLNYNSTELTIPAFNSTPAIVLDFSKTKKAESKILEARVVNLGTYNDLEYSFNEGYRESKTNLAEVGYQITRAEKAIREAKSTALLDRYPNFLKENKMKDNASIRDAFLERQADFVAAMDRLDFLKALEALLDGKVRVFENVCRYIKKQIEIDLRSGVDSNKYIR